jgi:hypothetical protein
MDQVVKLHFLAGLGASLGSFRGDWGDLYGVAIASTKWGPIVHQGRYIEGLGRLVS